MQGTAFITTTLLLTWINGSICLNDFVDGPTVQALDFSAWDHTHAQETVWHDTSDHFLKVHEESTTRKHKRQDWRWAALYFCHQLGALREAAGPGTSLPHNESIPVPDTTPMVRVWSRPKGLPTA